VTIKTDRKQIERNHTLTENEKIIRKLYEPTGTEADIIKDPETAHLIVHHNKVLGLHAVPGLEIEVEEIEDGIKIDVHLKDGTVVKNPIHMCFGMMPEEGIQKIIMKITIGKGAVIAVLAHCVFPNAVKVQHIMDADITIQEGASYGYLERHIHGEKGGVEVYPKATIHLMENARFTTLFDLVKGRVGLIDIEYESFCGKGSVIEMTAKVNGSKDDKIRINEIGHLEEKARGVLVSKIAVRDNAEAEIRNTLTASGADARGHVDCKEIVRDNAVATAIPVVKVNHPRAHITHEAAIGSVDKKQLETLMARGLSEDDASDVIIQGLLS
jgi:uncharacterized protein